MKKRFGESKNRVISITKVFSFLWPQELQKRFLIFVYLVLLEGVRYRLYLLNAKFCRIMLFFTPLENLAFGKQVPYYMWKIYHEPGSASSMIN